MALAWTLLASCLCLACESSTAGAPAASIDGPRVPQAQAESSGQMPRAAPETGQAPEARAPASQVGLGPGDQVPPEQAIAWRDPGGLPRAFIGMKRSQDSVVDLLRQATPTAFVPVGSTSTVFKMTLDAPIDAAFKSTTTDRPHGPAAEVAAYRLSRCLGLRTVPPAVSRRIPEAALRSAFDGAAGISWQDISAKLIRTERDLVPGVAIYWIPDMSDVGIDEPGEIARWTRWLTLGEPIPDQMRPLAAHISTMLVFDYLIGNFDRFSGGNARGDRERTFVYLRDHDIAFGARLSSSVHRRILSRMLRAQRFSKTFARALGELSRACFLRELARDPAWQDGKLLSESRIDGVFERLETAKSHIDSLIQLHGRKHVLAFE